MAAAFAVSIQQDSDITIVSHTDKQFDEDLQLYSHRQDKAWGLTDCASFLIMTQQNITQALAHDVHFQQAGFIALLRGD